jgi:hypothetical protein
VLFTYVGFHQKTLLPFGSLMSMWVPLLTQRGLRSLETLSMERLCAMHANGSGTDPAPIAWDEVFRNLKSLRHLTLWRVFGPDVILESLPTRATALRLVTITRLQPVDCVTPGSRALYNVSLPSPRVLEFVMEQCPLLHVELLWPADMLRLRDARLVQASYKQLQITATGRFNLVGEGAE